MQYKTTTAPAKEPVTLTEAKLWLRVDTDDDDDLIESLIEAARDYCQQYEGRAYVEQTITAYCDNFSRILYLPMPPVLDITSIHYRDRDDAWQAVSSDYWTLRDEIEPAYIKFDLTGLSYVLSYYPNRIRIIYTSGYTYADGESWLGSVPERVKAAMSLLIGHWYERRLATCEEQIREIPIGVKSLLSERAWLNVE